MTSKDLWLVAVGDPPFHFGPFATDTEADEYVGMYGGAVYPLWEPENEHAHVQDERTRGHFRSAK